MTDLLATAFADLQAEARESGAGADVLLMRASPGDWAAGVVVGWERREAPFGIIEVLILAGVRTNADEAPHDGTRRLDLDAAVLKRELGTDAESAPKVGSLVYVEAQGDRVSGKGTRYRGFTVRKSDPTTASLAAVEAARANAQDPAPAGDSDIPF
jgi:hypothetical protein